MRTTAQTILTHFKLVNILTQWFSFQPGCREFGPGLTPVVEIPWSINPLGVTPTYVITKLGHCKPKRVWNHWFKTFMELDFSYWNGTWANVGNDWHFSLFFWPGDKFSTNGMPSINFGIKFFYVLKTHKTC